MHTNRRCEVGSSRCRCIGNRNHCKAVLLWVFAIHRCTSRTRKNSLLIYFEFFRFFGKNKKYLSETTDSFCFLTLTDMSGYTDMACRAENVINPVGQYMKQGCFIISRRPMRTS